MEQSKQRHCNKTLASKPVAEVPVGFPMSPKFARPLSAVFIESSNMGEYLRPMYKAQEAIENQIRCPSVEPHHIKKFQLTISELSGIWFVTGGFSLASLCLTLALWTKQKFCSRRGKIDSKRPFERFDQNGQRLQCVHREDSWILKLKGEIKVETRRRGVYKLVSRAAVAGRIEGIDKTEDLGDDSSLIEPVGYFDLTKKQRCEFEKHANLLIGNSPSAATEDSGPFFDAANPPKLSLNLESTDGTQKVCGKKTRRKKKNKLKRTRPCSW